MHLSFGVQGQHDPRHDSANLIKCTVMCPLPRLYLDYSLVSRAYCPSQMCSDRFHASVEAECYIIHRLGNGMDLDMNQSAKSAIIESWLLYSYTCYLVSLS